MAEESVALKPSFSSIERPTGMPFRDGHYYATAALATTDHLSVLEALEAAV